MLHRARPLTPPWPLPTLPRLAWQQLLFACLGFAPIGAMCIALFGLVPLNVGARWLVLPAAVATIALALAFPRWGVLAAKGYAAGVLATAAYDITRLALVAAGVWPDFIPPIGRLAWLDEHASAFWGYAWRFLGNGGGMGLAFAMLPWRGVRAGMVYGLAICACLFLTLLFAPGAQDALFTLGPLTVAASILGHLDYGCILGLLLKRWTTSPAMTPEAAPVDDLAA